MDQTTLLQILDRQMNKINESRKLKEEYCIAKSNNQKLLSDLESKNQTLLNGILSENESLATEISELERQLFELEMTCSNEAKSLTAQQKIAGDKALEMKMMVDFKTQYSQRIAKATAYPSKKDVELLEKCKKKLEAYVKMSGVVWDFDSCDKTTISGYIRNETDTKMKIFNVNIDGKSLQDIVDEMWKLIKKYSLVS